MAIIYSHNSMCVHVGVLYKREIHVYQIHSPEQVIFFQGVAPPLRKEVWPFLLGLYSFDSSERERTRVKSKKLEEYWTINKRRFVAIYVHVM